jgi:hypothetical protein
VLREEEIGRRGLVGDRDEATWRTSGNQVIRVGYIGEQRKRYREREKRRETETRSDMHLEDIMNRKRVCMFYNELIWD